MKRTYPDRDSSAATARRVTASHAHYGNEVAAQFCDRLAESLDRFDPDCSAHYKRAAYLIRRKRVLQ